MIWAVTEHACERWAERVAPGQSADEARVEILSLAPRLPDGGRTAKGDRVLLGERDGQPFGLVVKTGPAPGRKRGRRQQAGTQTVVTVLGPAELRDSYDLPDAAPPAGTSSEEGEGRGRWRRAALALAAAIIDGTDPAAAFARALEAQPRLVDALARDRGLT